MNSRAHNLSKNGRDPDCHRDGKTDCHPHEKNSKNAAKKKLKNWMQIGNSGIMAALRKRSAAVFANQGTIGRMKILVAVKRVIDPYVKVRVRADGADVEKSDVKMAMNPFCENALEAALRWKDEGLADEVIAVSAGAADSADTLRMALAVGADRAILIKTDNTPEPLIAAKLIAAVAKRENPGAIWCGKQATDGDFNQTGQMIAALLGWGQALFLSGAKLENGAVHADSEIDSGIAALKVKTPCVLTADLRLNDPRYATLPNIMKARKKPLEEISPADLGVDCTPRLKILKVSEPPPRKAGRRVADAAELARVLREEAKVLR